MSLKYKPASVPQHMRVNAHAGLTLRHVCMGRWGVQVSVQARDAHGTRTGRASVSFVTSFEGTEYGSHRQV